MFTLIDPTRPQREFSFVLDVSDGSYCVPLCDPPVAVAELVPQLNQDRNLSRFIKRGELLVHDLS